MIDNLNLDLSKQLINSKVLLQDFILADESSRKSSSYSDPTFAPFYYYLGKYVMPKSMLCVGLRLGLLTGCFLKSCKTVEDILAVEKVKESYYSPRIARKNIKNNYKGNFEFQMFDSSDSFESVISKKNYDIVIVDEEFDYDKGRILLDMVWNKLSDDGIIVMEYLSGVEKNNGIIFEDFAKVHNRDVVNFKTRYKVGIIRK